MTILFMKKNTGKVTKYLTTKLEQGRRGEKLEKHKPKHWSAK